MMNKKNKKSGFTLVELLVVLVILMVIGTIAVQNFSGEEDKAKVKATKASFTQIETALERYKLDVGNYPSEDEGLMALMQAPEGDEGDWAGKYLSKQKAILDAWGNDYLYSMPGPDDESYEIASLGADGEEGGEKFNADLSNLDG
ncbi:MAG: type II secretion system major pseudopilin GspG [Verrucomicrobia bacterium]|nr:type II secretion system major pseudopilin GspG [Verrucomicrobiota bacterium]